jgi:hypothetical protein
MGEYRESPVKKIHVNLKVSYFTWRKSSKLTNRALVKTFTFIKMI